MSNKDKKADEYANQKVRDKNLYPWVEFSRRKQLTTFDAYELADAFEAGWDAACVEIKAEIIRRRNETTLEEYNNALDDK